MQRRPFSRMDIRRRLGLNLRRIREERELSQEELAFECGLHRTYVSGIERGVRNPTITVLERLAENLGVSPGSLIEAPAKRK